jgi:hypothetical protein
MTPTASVSWLALHRTQPFIQRDWYRLIQPEPNKVRRFKPQGVHLLAYLNADRSKLEDSETKHLYYAMQQLAWVREVESQMTVIILRKHAPCLIGVLASNLRFHPARDSVALEHKFGLPGKSASPKAVFLWYLTFCTSH